jgi:hypothetical protein
MRKIILMLLIASSPMTWAHNTSPASGGTMTVIYGGAPGTISVSPSAGEACTVTAQATAARAGTPLLSIQNSSPQPGVAVSLSVTATRQPLNNSETTSVSLTWSATGSTVGGTPDPNCSGAGAVSFSVTVVANNSGTTPPTSSFGVLTVKKAGTGSGTVADSVGSINCGTICTDNPLPGTTVKLIATPSSGSTFAGWSGCDKVEGDLSCTMTMNADKLVTASFVAVPSSYRLTVTKAGPGSGGVNSRPGNISCGDVCTDLFLPGTQALLVAEPASQFSAWSGCDVVQGNSCIANMNRDRSVQATFTSPPQYKLSVTATNSGTVTAQPQDATGVSIDCGATCVGTYDAGSMVTLLAPSVKSWAGCDAPSSDSTCTVTMNSNRTVSATFPSVVTPPPPPPAYAKVTIRLSGAGSGSVVLPPDALNWTGGTGTTLDNRSNTLICRRDLTAQEQADILAGRLPAAFLTCETQVPYGTRVTFSAHADRATTAYWPFKPCGLNPGPNCTVTPTADTTIALQLRRPILLTQITDRTFCWNLPASNVADIPLTGTIANFGDDDLIWNTGITGISLMEDSAHQSPFHKPQGGGDYSSLAGGYRLKSGGTSTITLSAGRVLRDGQGNWLYDPPDSGVHQLLSTALANKVSAAGEVPEVYEFSGSLEVTSQNDPADTPRRFPIRYRVNVTPPSEGIFKSLFSSNSTATTPASVNADCSSSAPIGSRPTGTAGFSLSLPAPAANSATINRTANVSFTLASVPQNPVIHTVVGDTWKQIYPNNQCADISDVSLSNSAFSYSILDNGDCDADGSSGNIYQVVAVGSLDPALACTASVSSDLTLRVPFVAFGGGAYWADFAYSPSVPGFTMTKIGQVASVSPYSACTPATVTPDLKFHIPGVQYSGANYFIDMNYTGGATFGITGIGTGPK